MDKPHTIGSAVLDIGFESRRDVLTQQHDLGEFLGRQLMPVVDEVFDELCDADEDWEIDRLEIDLGNMTSGEFRNEIAGRLRQQLRRALKLHSRGPARKPTRTSAVVSRESEREAVQRFLVSGRLPASAGSATIERMIEHAWTTDRAWLMTLIKRSPAQAMMIDRLVARLPDRVLRDIARALAPGDATMGVDLVDVCLALGVDRGLVENDRQGAARHLWSQLMAELLAPDVRAIGAMRLVVRVLKGTAARGGTDYQVLVRSLGERATEILKAAGAEGPLLAILAHLALRNGVRQPDRGNSREPARQSAERSVRQRLDDVTANGSVDAIREVWEAAVHDRPLIVIDALQHYARQPHLRARMSEVFPEPILIRIVDLLEPGGSRFIEAIVHDLMNPARLDRVIRLDRHLWEFILGYVLDRRGRPFERREYLDAVVREMATRSGAGYSAMLRSLRARVEENDSPDALTQDVRRLLGEIEASRTPTVDSNTAEPADDSPLPKRVRATVLRDHLELERVSERVSAALESGSSEGIAEIWPAFLKNQPDSARRMLERLLRGPEARRKVAARFSEAMLLEILRLLEPRHATAIGHRLRGGADGLDRDRWRLAVEQLVRGRGAEAPTTRPEALDTSAVVVLGADGAPHSAEVIRAYGLVDDVRGRLQSDDPSTPGQTARLVEAIKELARTYPWPLMRLYRELQTGEVPLERLNSRLSTDELRALIEAWVLVTTADGSSETAGAIERSAHKAAYPRGYYWQVLRSLVAGRAMDCERMAEESRAPEAGELDRVEPLGPGMAPGADRRPSDTFVHTPSWASTGRLADDALAGYLRGDGVPSAADAALLTDTVNAMLVLRSEVLRGMLEAALDVPGSADRIVALLPESVLTRLVYLLWPTEHAAVQRRSDIVADASVDRKVPAARIRDVTWRFIFTYLSGTAAVFNEEHFASKLRAELAAENGSPDVEALSARVDDPPAHRSTIEETRWPAEEGYVEPVPTEGLHIMNAGQVLAAPFIPELFARLGLIEDRAFVSRDSVERAVHSLQFMVNGTSDIADHQLPLNKILCGVPRGVRLSGTGSVPDTDRDIIESLIRGMIHHWKIIGNTSVDGFRQSFLQRSGVLRLSNDTWRLSVEKRAFDVLLDRIPWAFSTIKLPWMKRLLHVKWR